MKWTHVHSTILFIQKPKINLNELLNETIHALTLQTGYNMWNKNTPIEKMQHRKINHETVSVLSFGQLLTGLDVRS